MKPPSVPLLQHSTDANEKGWGTICMQINVHLDCLLKRVQRVQFYVFTMKLFKHMDYIRAMED